MSSHVLGQLARAPPELDRAALRMGPSAQGSGDGAQMLTTYRATGRTGLRAACDGLSTLGTGAMHLERSLRDDLRGL